MSWASLAAPAPGVSFLGLTLLVLGFLLTTKVIARIAHGRRGMVIANSTSRNSPLWAGFIDHALARPGTAPSPAAAGLLASCQGWARHYLEPVWVLLVSWVPLALIGGHMNELFFPMLARNDDGSFRPAKPKDVAANMAAVGGPLAQAFQRRVLFPLARTLNLGLGHIQTVFAALEHDWPGPQLLEPQPSPAAGSTPFVPTTLATGRLPYVREHVQLTGGAVISLDWAVCDAERDDLTRWLGSTTVEAAIEHGPDEEEALRAYHAWKSRPVVLILHGLSGSSGEGYVQGFIRLAAVSLGTEGVGGAHSDPLAAPRYVVLNARGCGDSPVRTALLFCGSYTDDLRTVVRYLREYRMVPNPFWGTYDEGTPAPEPAPTTSALDSSSSSSSCSSTTTATATATATPPEMSIRTNTRCPPLLAVGFSIGANILLNFTGESADQRYRASYSATAVPLVDAVASVCNPFDFELCSIALQGLDGSVVPPLLFAPAMTAGLRTMFSNMVDVFHPEVEADSDDTPAGAIPLAPSMSSVDRLAFFRPVAAEDVLNARSLRQVDMALTTRLFGFDQPEDYYNDAGCLQRLLGIARPTLILSALNDPIAVPEALPSDEVMKNPNLVMAITASGGHVAWHETDPAWPTADRFGRRSWSSRPLVSYFSMILHKYFHNTLEKEVASLGYTPAKIELSNANLNVRARLNFQPDTPGMPDNALEWTPLLPELGRHQRFRIFPRVHRLDPIHSRANFLPCECLAPLATDTSRSVASLQLQRQVGAGSGPVPASSTSSRLDGPMPPCSSTALYKHDDQWIVATDCQPLPILAVDNPDTLLATYESPIARFARLGLIGGLTIGAAAIIVPTLRSWIMV
ncbi:hypothetical protein H696_03429 [Fonticula alba]|uniref:AB hydrolase-1 domain-containing protein n=1 Tax=Fonticula alba TaxID=691883 RepID=A0A058Z6T1_FONAL|nr:hypothetical protein H696_03429 [Fonticula alba]KCV69964.1 hypothetical protein H696_03429 [Fonticula alba]|eukprot:XP_009495570.1 hypothetical protein H696_03429 [Fonticula alba]